jgi:hypothetical protein
MHLSKPDILQAAMVGLTLVVSAVAVPVIASGQDSQPLSEQTAESTPQPAQQNHMYQP